MRILIDSLVALMLTAIVIGAVLNTSLQDDRSEAIERVQADVVRLQREINLRGVLGEVECNERGHPLTVDPSWFSVAKIPRNHLLNGHHPWLEIAGQSQQDMRHPPQWIAVDVQQAGLWYNPANGVVRARVPADLPVPQAVELYNRINNCDLAADVEEVSVQVAQAEPVPIP